jgi:ABC-type multidrug transport system fused ATPase/permease subunit
MWPFDGASENALWDFLELANAAAFVKDLPQGIDTVVVDRRTLSPQAHVNELSWQGLVLCKPELLILDEASSAMDK